MALSNIFREPRREITESVIGTIPIALFCWLDYRFAVWFQAYTMSANSNDYVTWEAGLLIGVVGLLLIFLVTAALLLLCHAIGEVICDSLGNKGLELRP